MTRNDEVTASALKDALIKRFGAEKVLYSVRTIARIRNELGWSFTTARYCQAIREANKTKRLDWCNKRIGEKETFVDVIFMDESTVQLEHHRRKCFRKKKMPRKLKYKHNMATYCQPPFCLSFRTSFRIITDYTRIMTLNTQASTFSGSLQTTR